ncbi:MAG: 3'-5' exoribonuclease, partial [Anaerolineales bacterium]|nr:3'-5' exoribonuclease [Anaerolineales bacterium]
MTKRTLVALDIETTGLELKTDKITEIGAVRFTEKGIEEEFETLVNPGIKIPPFISQLTGITDAMVRGDKIPYIEEAISQLIDFVGDVPVIGHNVKFDLSFLRAAGALKKNSAIDTYEMASVILPSEGRYNLRALGQVLGVPMRATHRALDDTKVTQAIYQIMFGMILDLPLPTLGEIVRLSPGPVWGGTLPFKWALEDKKKSNPSDAGEPYQNPLLSQAPPLELKPIEPKETIKGLDLDEVSSVLEPGGPFHKTFPDYEHRSEQLEMLRAASRAISDGRHYLIEAGTGIGKSLAYLIPAALWATKNQQRVVISTNTINLQDQLISKDIPLLLDTMDLKCRAT